MGRAARPQSEYPGQAGSRARPAQPAQIVILSGYDSAAGLRNRHVDHERTNAAGPADPDPGRMIESAVFFQNHVHAFYRSGVIGGPEQRSDTSLESGIAGTVQIIGKGGEVIGEGNPFSGSGGMTIRRKKFPPGGRLGRNRLAGGVPEETDGKGWNHGSADFLDFLAEFGRRLVS